MRERISERTVIKDYWYEIQHLEELGNKWSAVADDRLFILPNAGIIQASEASIAQEQIDAVAQTINKTGITKSDVDAIKTPRKVMLPLNKGGDHWAAITADVTIAPNGKRAVKLSFTDSLGKEQNYDLLPKEIKEEMSRISGLFSRDDAVTTELYPYTWKQPDGSSCGPYSFANAVRCLAGKGAEPNPGREVVRAQQLDMMTDEANIRACSTNNAIDEIIRVWVIDRAVENKPFLLDSDSRFTEMCEHFANIKRSDIGEVLAIFIDEDPRIMSYAQRRMRELIASDDIINASVASDKLAGIREEMKHENLMQKFQVMLNMIESETEMGAGKAHEFVAEIMEHLGQMQIETATEKIFSLGNEKITAYFLNNIVDIVSTRTIETDYNNKMEGLAAAYSGISRAEGEIKKLPRSIISSDRHVESRTGESASASLIKDLDKSPVEDLKKYKRLLKESISRNDAGLVKQIGYAIKDFCEDLVSLISFGTYKPDYKLINAIEERIALPPVTPEFSKDIRKDFIKIELNKVKDKLGRTVAPSPVISSLRSSKGSFKSM
jgi:hypothetical protein